MWHEAVSDIRVIWGWMCALFDWLGWITVRVGFALCAILLPVAVIVLVELASCMKRRSEKPSS